MAYLRTRNFDGRDHRAWKPYNEYEVHETRAEPALNSHGHGDHKNKHVGFKTKYEETIDAEKVGAGSGRENEKVVERVKLSTESVDDEADAFIKQQHKRIELAKLMSMRAGSQY